MATLNPSELKQQSTAYWYYRPFWTDCLNLYEPLPDTLQAYLRRYEKEEDNEFANRCASLAQINMVYLIVESTLSMLCSTKLEIKSQQHQDKVDSFCNCCTPQGDSIADFVREQLGPTAFVYGLADVVIDMPEQKDDKLSVEQARARGLQPYAYVVPPINRYNWAVDSNGNFSMYRSEDILNTQIQGNLQLGGSASEQKEYQVWTLETVERYDSYGNMVSTKKNPYGFIPITTCAPVSRSMRFPNERLGRSLVQDILPLQRQIINVMSLIYDYHESANFPYRILKQDTSDGEEPPTQEEIMEQGNKRGLLIRGANSDYFLAQPNPAGVTAMIDYLQQLVERCYQQVLMPSDATTNKTHQSGNSIRSNMAALYNKLTTYTKRLEKTVKEIVEMALRVQGIDPFEAQIKVSWDTNFAFESFTNSQQQLSLVIQNLSDKSPTSVAEFAKKVMSPQFYGSTVMDKVLNELDKWAAKPVPDPLMEGNTPDTTPKTAQQQNTQLTASEKISEDEEGGDE
jgi:hypothetical protein